MSRSSDQNPSPDSPIIIIGAARSGTNLLRDTLTSIPGLATWPCDEINPIWRYGNRGLPHDELHPSHATPQIRRFIHRQFRRISSKHGGARVVEKTCANSLRVSFVDSMFPRAQFVWLIRDGVDVAVSASKRWNARMDLGYLLKKARWVPKSDIPYYAGRWMSNRLSGFSSSDRRVSTWGPVFRGMPEFLREQGVLATCGRQWVESVEQADAALSSLPSSRVFRLRYEEFVRSPVETVLRIADYLGENIQTQTAKGMIQNVSPDRIGSGMDELNPEHSDVLHSVLGDTLTRYGYR